MFSHVIEDACREIATTAYADDDQYKVAVIASRKVAIAAYQSIDEQVGVRFSQYIIEAVESGSDAPHQVASERLMAER